MKLNFLLLFLVASLTWVTGCASYDYQIVEPASLTHRITDQPVTVSYEPLQYSMSRYKDRLGMTIINPTAERVTLRGDRSYVIDPRGESHPVRGRTLGPRSYSAMLWPPVPASGTMVYPGFYGPGWWGWGPYPYPGYWGGFYPDYYGPTTSYYQIYTPFDWKWKEGQAHMHLSYEQNGRHFDHDFVILRQREKK